MSELPYTVWHAAPTKEQLKELLSADGWLEKLVVPVTLNEIMRSDFEGFLDIISARSGYDRLQDINYWVEGHDGDTLHIGVSGDASEMLDDD